MGASKCLQEAPALPRLPLAFSPGSKLTRQKKTLFWGQLTYRTILAGVRSHRKFRWFARLNRDTLWPSFAHWNYFIFPMPKVTDVKLKICQNANLAMTKLSYSHHMRGFLAICAVHKNTMASNLHQHLYLTNSLYDTSLPFYFYFVCEYIFFSFRMWAEGKGTLKAAKEKRIG